MIEKLDLYLQALAYKKDQFTRQQEEFLLQQLLNANSEEEIRQQIMQDIDEFNSYCDGSYKTYIGIFSNFLDEYRINLEELASLQQMQKSILNAADFLGGNNVSFGTSGGGYGGSTGGRTYSGSYATLPNGMTTPVTIVNGKTQQTDLPVGTIVHTANGGDWKVTGGTGTASDPYTSEFVGYNNNTSGSKYSGSYVNNYGTAYGSNTSYNGGRGSYGGGSSGSIHDRVSSANSTLLSGGKYGNVYLKGYAGGLDEGPVTSTGPAMLHGTSSSPEYVLTSDQASNVVENANDVTEGLTDLASDGTVNIGQDEVNVDAGEQYEGEGNLANEEGGITGGDSAPSGGEVEGAQGEGGTGGTGTGSGSGTGGVSGEAISKIVSLLSQLVSLQGTNNTQVGQIYGLTSQLLSVMNNLYTLEQTDSVQDYEMYGQMVELLTMINEFLNVNVPTILNNQSVANNTLNSILQMINSGVQQVSAIANILGAGMSGSFTSSQGGGSWTGSFKGGGGGVFGSGNASGGSGGGGYGGGGGSSGGSSHSGSYLELPGLGTMGATVVNGKLQQTNLPAGTILNNPNGQRWQITGGSGTDDDPYTSVLLSGGSSSSSSSRGSGSSSKGSGGSGSSSSSFHDRVSSSKDTLSSGGKVGNVYLKSYDTGIENGPVDFTGLAMLHGTPSEPEYVLNNDQAYNLLTNLTTKKAETEKVGGDTDNSTNYNVYGDIVLEGVNDPAEFWNAMNKSISNRRNVTKNSKKL